MAGIYSEIIIIISYYINIVYLNFYTSSGIYLPRVKKLIIINRLKRILPWRTGLTSGEWSGQVLSFASLSLSLSVSLSLFLQ